MIEPMSGRDLRVLNDEGRPSSPIWFVGEAPGPKEHLALRPFAPQGGSGKMLRGECRSFKIDYDKTFKTNVLPYWPGPQDQSIKLVPKATIEHYGEKLVRKVKKHKPYMVVAYGNYALKALTGHEKISQRRGYVHFEHGTLVYPMLHPAAVLRSPSDRPTWRRDMGRLVEILRGGYPTLDQAQVTVARTLKQLEHFVAFVQRHPKNCLVFDIETTRRGQPMHPRIKCLAFAIQGSKEKRCIVVPTMGNCWPKRSFGRVMRLVKVLLTGPNPKGTQNGQFDCFYVPHVWGFEVNNWAWDTRGMPHVLDPDLGPPDDETSANAKSARSFSSLNYLCSIDLWVEHWKDKEDSDLFYYNGCDAWHQHSLYLTYRRRLKRAGQTGLYRRTHGAIMPRLLKLTQHGVQANVTKIAVEKKRLGTIKDCAALALQKICGRKMVAKKGLSPKAMREVFYGDGPGCFDLPPVENRVTGRVTLDKEAIRSIEAENEDNGRVLAACRNVRLFQDSATEIKFLSETHFDDDGRFRSSYAPFAKSFRQRSSENPTGSGGNGQNFPRPLRKVMVPDRDCILLQVDGAQAEDKVVAALTGSQRLIDLANRPPWVGDSHAELAEEVELCDDMAALKERAPTEWYRVRYLAKRIRHGTNYGLGPKTLVATILKDTGEVFSESWARSMQRKVATLNPEIPEWQDRNKTEVIEHRCMSNSWGATITFDLCDMDADTFRLAHSWRPQSEVGMLFNYWGFIVAHDWLTKRNAGAVNAHTHDGVLCSVKPKYAWGLWRALKRSLERPRAYNGTLLSIPLELTIGADWGFKGLEAREWKKPPTKEEFHEAVQGVVEAL